MEISLSLKKSLESTFEEYLEELFKLLVVEYGDEYNFDILDLRNKFLEYQIVIKKGNRVEKKKKANYRRNQSRNQSRNHKNKTEKDLNSKVKGEQQNNSIQEEDTSRPRCRARVWGNAYVDIKNKIYGKQCLNLPKKGNDYCKLHQVNRKHGCWEEEPSKSIKSHYLDYNHKNQMKKLIS